MNPKMKMKLEMEKAKMQKDDRMGNISEYRAGSWIEENILYAMRPKTI